MSEMIVRTKEDFKRAVEICPDKIIFKDEMAEVVKKVISQKKLKKKIGIGSGILAGAGVLAGIVAAPFTGGASLGVTALSFAAGTAAAGTITVSTSLFIAGLTANAVPIVAAAFRKPRRLHLFSALNVLSMILLFYKIDFLIQK